MTTERVQALASTGNLKELPKKFIRSADERMENTKPLEGVPVLVISLTESGSDLLVKEIHKACNEWGFFLLKVLDFCYTRKSKLFKTLNGFTHGLRP